MMPKRQRYFVVYMSGIPSDRQNFMQETFRLLELNDGDNDKPYERNFGFELVFASPSRPRWPDDEVPDADEYDYHFTGYKTRATTDWFEAHLKNGPYEKAFWFAYLSTLDEECLSEESW